MAPGSIADPPSRHLSALPTPSRELPDAEPLPRFRTSFVGRESVVRTIAGHLADPECRLITIVGRSGVGKTRLALEIARAEAASARGQVYLVELGRLTDGGDIAGLVASALGTSRVPGQSADEAIRRRLRHVPAVLVADDIDHVGGAASVLLDLASESPRTVVLATAHRPTAVPGERVVRLDGLAVPDREERDATRLLANPALILYADRAAALDPGFQVTTSNVHEVAELVRSLDGLPLAIELGATRARLLTPAAQLAALAEDSGLDLRASRSDGRPERHRELRSAVAGSYAVASEAGRLVLRRISVAADAVTSGRVRELVPDAGWTLADVLDALGELVDLGLADVDRRRDGEPRFRLHATIAAYGRERLAADDEEAATTRRYRAAVRALARDARVLPRARWLEALVAGSTELHAVFGTLAAAGADDPQSAEAALELAADLGPLWAQRGLFQGPGSALERLLGDAESGEIAVDPGTLSRAQGWWCRLVVHDSAPSRYRDAVRARLERAVANARVSGDPETLLQAFDAVVKGVFVVHDMAAVSAATDEAYALAQQLRDPAALRRAEYTKAMLANLAGDVATATRFAGPALKSSLEAQDLIDTIRVCSVLWTIPPGTPGLPTSIPSPEALLQAALDSGELVEASLLHALLAAKALGAGDVAGSARWALRGLNLAQQLGGWHAGGMVTAALVLLANGARDDLAVASLHGSMTPILPDVLTALGPWAPPYNAALVASRERLGAAEFDQAVADAALLDRDAAIEHAADFARHTLVAVGAGPTIHPVPAGEGAARGRRTGLDIPKPDTPDRPERLTPRELDVLRALMTGATNGAIASSLGLRPKTVMHHSMSIYAKLGVRGRTEATAWAYRNGLDADPGLSNEARAAS